MCRRIDQKKGLAYVDDLTSDEMEGNTGEPLLSLERKAPYRNRVY